jgi:hypothetical protein
MKLILILTFLTLTFKLWALTPEEKLLPLINDEIKLLSSGKNLSLFTRYRLFELQVEKLRVIYNQENKAFIQDAKTSKDLAFSESRKLYTNCKKMGQELLRSNIDAKMIAATYYALALNDRDYAFENKTEDYFLKALAAASKYPEIRQNIQVTLAEYYYNEKKYEKAYGLYQQIIKTVDQKWHAKNLLNAAWTSVMLKKFKEGVDLLQTAAAYATDTRNMGPMSLILDSAPLFFLEADQFNEGIAFIQKYGGTDQMSLLTKMHKRASSKGFYNWCEDINALIEKMPVATPSDWETLKAYRTYVFDHYRNFSKKAEILKLISKFNFIDSQSHYADEERTVVAEKYKDYLLYMQTALLKNFVKGTIKPSGNEQQIHQEIDTIADFLISFDTKNASYYYFHKGEISLALHMHAKAAGEYFIALEKDGITPRTEDNVEIKKVFNSLFATLNPDISYQTLSKSALTAQTLKAYQYYLTIFPSLETSKEIYQKSFLLHLDEKLFPESEKLLVMFQTQFPKEDDASKRMTKTLLDRYIKDKNIEGITRWATLLNSQQFFDKTEMKTLTQSLANLHLDQNKIKEDKNKVEALVDLNNLFNDKIYDDETRQHFSRKALILSLEIFDGPGAKIWLKRFLELTPKKSPEDVKLMIVAGKLFHDLQDYQLAHETFLNINKETKMANSELELATINAFLMSQSNFSKTLKYMSEFGEVKNEPALVKTVQWMVSNLYYQGKFSEIDNIPNEYLSMIKISDLLFYYYSPLHLQFHSDIASNIKKFFPDQMEKMKKSEENLSLLEEKVAHFKGQTLEDKGPFNPEQFSAKVGAFLEFYKAIDDLEFPQDFGIKQNIIEKRKLAFSHLTDTFTKYNPETSDKDLKRAVKGELKKIVKKLQKKNPYL